MGRPNRKWQLLGVAGALGLVVAVCLLAPGPGWQAPTGPPPPPPAQSKGPAMPQASLGSLPVQLKDGIGRAGDPSAKVKIEVYFPGHSSCGNETADFAYRVWQANKGKVQVLFIDFDSAKGGELQTESGMHCSGVAINGEQEFEVRGDDGSKRTVDTTSNIGDRWGDREFLSALDVVFREEYGTPANHKLPPSKIGSPGHGSPKSGPPSSAAKAGKSGGAS
ncbi:MAG: hypothetical protein FJX75_21915 [Armatimonadetes bacterium]|nr:hypothetical protein [Armatimonadota bacterium]